MAGRKEGSVRSLSGREKFGVGRNICVRSEIKAHAQKSRHVYVYKSAQRSAQSD
jgi:hypothetical protein